MVELRKPETDAKLIAEGIAEQLCRRVAFRRAMKRGVTSALRLGAQGIKIACAGRLGGAEMARREWYREDQIPLIGGKNVDSAMTSEATAGLTVSKLTK